MPKAGSFLESVNPFPKCVVVLACRGASGWPGFRSNDATVRRTGWFLRVSSNAIPQFFLRKKAAVGPGKPLA
jgi:hypothetical protein